MEQLTQIALLIIGAAFSPNLAVFGFVSITEKEKRAARISFSGALLGVAFFVLATSLPTSARVAVLALLIALFLGFIVLFFLPI